MSQKTDKPARPPGGPRKKPRGLFMKQPVMLRVVYALIPVGVAGIYFFGWRVLAIVATVAAVGLATEYLTARQRGQAISMACFVTCLLYALSLPPTVPLWVAGVGVAFGLLFGKEVFGGFGRNFANPAIVGRTFVYICFPTDLTGRFVPAFRGFPTGFGHWSFESLDNVPAYLRGAVDGVHDAITQASPMWVGREYGLDAVRNAGAGASIWDMMLGSISGLWQAPDRPAAALAAGSIGEGCGVLIVLAGVYLLATRTANWRLMLSGLAGVLAANGLFRNLLGFDGPGEVPPVLWQLFAGTTLYAVVFMVTDPVSATKRRPAQFAYGFFIGFLVVVLRWRGIFVAAASFSILMGNLVGPWLDLGAEAWEQRRKARAASSRPAAKGGQPA